MAQGTGVEGIEEPSENDDVHRDPLVAPHTSNKDGTPTIAGVVNAELLNVQKVEIKEGTTTLPVEGPDKKDSGGKLAMEEKEVVVKTKFPIMSSSQKTSSNFAKLPKSEVMNRLKPVKRSK